MSMLFYFSFSIYGANRPIGASTGMAYISSILFGMDADNYSYIKEIEKSGAWETVMLVGVFFGGLFTSLFITKSFHISYIPSLWKERKNNSVKSRMIWSFIAGHILSGRSQLAMSSIVFAIFALGTGVITGRFFYKKKVCKND